MLRLQREPRTPRFVPDYLARSVEAVDFKQLADQGIRYIAFDADSTLVNFRGRELSPSTKLFLQKQRKLFDKWCIASNRITNDLLPLAESMDAQVIRASLWTRKPSRRFFNTVLTFFGGKPQEIAMIGDKLIADIWGAKRAGMVTIWVEKIGQDNPLDWIFRVRQIEKWLMRAYRPKK
ncbi:MAG: HAD hydrolase-like protein [Patescibacteria group bacterium]